MFWRWIQDDGVRVNEYAETGHWRRRRKDKRKRRLVWKGYPRVGVGSSKRVGKRRCSRKDAGTLIPVPCLSSFRWLGRNRGTGAGKRASFGIVRVVVVVVDIKRRAYNRPEDIT